jgi:hypothetical protein
MCNGSVCNGGVCYESAVSFSAALMFYPYSGFLLVFLLAVYFKVCQLKLNAKSGCILLISCVAYY